MIILFVFKVQFKMNLNLPGYVNCYQCGNRCYIRGLVIHFFFLRAAVSNSLSRTL